jgi:hypothetical protein
MRERYGTDHPRRRIVLVVATTVLAMVFLAWVVWVAIFHGDPAIDSKVTSYDVVNAHQVNVQLDTRFRDAKTKGTCLVRATASDHSIVGELNLTAAQLRALGHRWIPIRTERRATTAEVVRCTGS